MVTTPAIVLQTAARAGSTLRRRAASRTVSGCGLPLRRRRAVSTPSTRLEEGAVSPADASTATVFLLEERHLRAVLLQGADEANPLSKTSTPPFASSFWNSAFLELPRPQIVYASGGSVESSQGSARPHDSRKLPTPS